jgi:Cd2+/Zn2+-exporting ATPase
MMKPHNTQILELPELHCPDCAAAIQKAVCGLPGVLWAEVNFSTVQLHVQFEQTTITLEQICRFVTQFDIMPRPVNAASANTCTAPTRLLRLLEWRRQHRKHIAFASAALLTLIGAAISATPLASLARWLFAGAIIVGGIGIARAALQTARSRAIDMNLLLTVAVLGAAGLGDWSEGASVIVLFNLGNLLQIGALERTRRSLHALMHLSPRFAHVRRNGAIQQIPVEQVGVDDIVLVKPGERISNDGVLIEGCSAVDQSPITGESMPVEKAPGDAVFAGTLNGSGALFLRVTHACKDTVLARIMYHVEVAQAQRAPTQEFIDRFTRIYTPVVVTLAALIAMLPPAFVTLWHLAHGAPPVYGVWQTWFVRALSMLLISCPCALVISTPVAIVTAIGNAARHGILVKGGRYLEAIGSVDVILYDKTGTLTQKGCQLETVTPLAEPSPQELIRIAAALEAHSDHPLASAFRNAARQQGDELLPFVRNFDLIPGGGVRGKIGGKTYLLGNRRLLRAADIPLTSALPDLDRADANGQTALLLADSKRLLGVLTVSNPPRPQAADAVRALYQLGVPHQAMLTGDSAHVALFIGKRVGLADVRSGLLPEQKLECVRAYREEHTSVAMVGDGINDAPALAAADVGIAMGGAGNDTALETADIVLMGDDLSHLPYLVGLSRRLRSIVQQNVAFSLLTKGLLLITAIIAGIPLWLAVVGDVGVSLAVTLNALRLWDRPDRRQPK